MAEKDSSNLPVRIILDLAGRFGVKHVVCSPGSRNSPLLIAAESREYLKKHVIIDERSAAFFGLGLASVSKSPVLLLCTSGTAVLNYAPAVAEAFYQGVPLIVVSADRPSEWIDQDDSQTIRQPEILRNIVKKSIDIPSIGEDDRGSDAVWFTNRIVNDILLTALRPKQGPVHINIRLAPPLTKVVGKQPDHWEERTITEVLPDPRVDPEDMKRLAEEAAGKRIMLVAGFHAPDSRLNRAVNEMGKLGNTVVMAESLANIHSAGNDLAAVDLPVSKAPDSLAPELIISIGGALVSRNLKEYLRRADKAVHWNVGHSMTTSDCFRHLSVKVETDPASFLLRLASLLRRRSIPQNAADYAKEWEKLRKESRKIHDDFVRNAPWSDLKAFDMILNSIPSSWNLFVSNGTPVRYAQLFKKEFHASFCNRGVSGIDGSTSTAAGGSAATATPTALITGDLSFVYDAGALALPENPQNPLVIFVINNQGGGIFRFIKSTASLRPDILERYFCAPPDIDIERLSAAYGWDYERIDEASLPNAPKMLSGIFKSGKRRRTVIEVFTDGRLSGDLLRRYFGMDSVVNPQSLQ